MILVLLYLLRTSTFVGIQSPIPEFERDEKEGKENQNQTTDVKELILALQEITSRIVSRKSKWHDKLINQQFNGGRLPSTICPEKP